MDHRSKLVTAFTFAFASFPVFAGFAQVSAPASYTSSFTNGATTTTGAFYKAATNDVSFTNGVRGSAGVLNVGGRSITMPAAYRFAPNAARFAAGLAFGNPALFVGVTAAALAYAWYTQNELVVINGAWNQNLTTEVWCYSGLYCGELLTAGRQAIAATNGTTISNLTNCFSNGGTATSRAVNCTYTPTGAVLGAAMQRQSVSTSPTPITQQQFEDKMAPIPIPTGVPQVFPFPLPVDNPILNPSPAAIPVSEPLRFPQGLPQPVPNTNPQQYRVPVIDAVPSPTLAEPWRVDLQPRDITTTSPTPLPDSAPVPSVEPAGQTTVVSTPDLCEKNPEILACQKWKPEALAPVVPGTDTKNVVINPDSGWGSSSGSCPTPRTAVVQGLTIAMPFTALCDLATGIRPFVIGFAWVSACMIFLGMGRKE